MRDGEVRQQPIWVDQMGHIHTGELNWLSAVIFVDRIIQTFILFVLKSNFQFIHFFQLFRKKEIVIFWK